MGDEELMKKHRLSSRGLRLVMQMLVEENAFERSELSELSPSYRNIAQLIDSRRTPRVYVPISFRISSRETSQFGFVRDISETGLRVAGIKVTVGEELTLSMPLKELETGDPLEFQAVCRWCKVEGKRKSYVVSGFEIVHISEKARVRLGEVIDFIHFQVEREEETRRTGLANSEILELGRKIGADRVSREFSGTVEGVDILDVVQLLLLCGQKVSLYIQSSEGHESVVHIKDGRIVHAVHGGLEGREAFYASMNVVGGRFRTQPWSEPPRKTIDVPGELLLLEAARRRDDPCSDLPSL